jgi:hypothetical protein
MAQMPYPAAPVSSSLLAAATASVRGDADVVDKTRHALAEAQRCGVYAFAAATERRLGEALGGSEGAAMIARADDSARKLGFTNPERAAEMAMPTARFAE